MSGSAETSGAAVGRLLRKIRGRSLHELYTRGTQAVHARVERLGDGAVALPAPADLLSADLAGAAPLDLFRREAARLAPGLRDLASTVAAVRALGLDDEAALLARAEAAAAGRFDLLGYRGLAFGTPIDWHLDPVSGRRAPLRHWSEIDFLDSGVVGDHKVVWELNRHQHLVTLGQAWALTGDERWADVLVAQLASWMDANPPKLGVNWASSLEVAFRSLAWLWALQLVRDSRALTPALFERACRHLWLHGRHLERYLSTYFAPNTHLTGEALGLFALGSALPWLRPAARWADCGWRILAEQLGRQVRPDGVYFEQASYYHRYTVDIYLHVILLARGAGRVVPEAMTARVNAAVDHLLAMRRPDGLLPLFGDDDAGRVLPLDGAPGRDPRASLALAAVLLDRGDCAAAIGAPSPELAWLLGADGVAAYDALPPRAPAWTSRAFADGGYYVMRSGWDADAHWCAVDCGPHGALIGAHGHADVLSFELSAYGRPVIVDPGTCTYMGAERDALRGAAAHNVVLVDDEPTAVPGPGPFRWRATAAGHALAWRAEADFDWLEGTHDGYQRLPEPLAVRRAVLFADHRFWVMRDRVEPVAPRTLSARFHAAPGVGITTVDRGRLSLDAGAGVHLELLCVAREGRFAVSDGWVSPAYGAREPAAVCAFAARDAEIVTVMVPWTAAEGRPTIEQLPAAGGTALRIRTAERDDLVLLRAAGAPRVRAEGIAARAECVWVARDAAGVTRRTVLPDGGTIETSNGDQS